MVLQLDRHVELAVALLVVVAALLGTVPGTTQPAWHDAAAELQLIMQLVVVEVCASRVLPPAEAAAENATTAVKAKTMLVPRMIVSSGADLQPA